MSPTQPRKARWLSLLLTVVLLAAVTGLGGYMRWTGSDWGDGTHLHPDERHLSMVENAIQPVLPGISYFDTAQSPLNPANQGYTFFVYGTFPIFLIRYVGEWIGQVGYDPITLVGRQLSALTDTFTILLVFLIGVHLYDRAVGLIAAALYAFAVLPIQQAHFMTVDSFTNTFGMLAVLVAVLILKQKLPEGSPSKVVRLQPSRLALFVLFGIALGLATASKINAVTLALMLPMVVFVRWQGQAEEDRLAFLKSEAVYTLIAAIVSFLVFRLGQPYAFKGPGFFNMGLDPTWLSGMQSLRSQSTGAMDWPPGLQWARRSFSFPYLNLLKWGIGLPWGILVFPAVLYLGWKIYRWKELDHLPVWAWMLLYTLWQTTSWVKSMRYLLLIYPLLAVFSAWLVMSLVRRKSPLDMKTLVFSAKTLRIAGTVLAIIAILGTMAYAFGFTSIYSRPMSRVEASDWIYQNLEGAINLHLKQDGSSLQIPAPYRSGDVHSATSPGFIRFDTDEELYLNSFTLQNYMVVEASISQPTLTAFLYEISHPDAAEIGPIQGRMLLADPTVDKPGTVVFTPDLPIYLMADKTYGIRFTTDDPGLRAYYTGKAKLEVTGMDGNAATVTVLPFMQTIQTGKPYEMDLTVLETGKVTSVTIPHPKVLKAGAGPLEIRLSLIRFGDPAPITVSDTLRIPTASEAELPWVFEFDQPLEITAPAAVKVVMEMAAGDGVATVLQTGLGFETAWDDALPVPRGNYVPFNPGGGIYRDDLNLDLYTTDILSKRVNMLWVLDEADYLVISSNRQWGTTTRVPERYPLTTLYYNELIGCPEGTSILKCYAEAEPGMFEGRLGFDLIKTFTSYPTLGSIRLNDQLAEEAFTVYDHPKVLIFRKSADYDHGKVTALLESVDLSLVQHITARQADDFKPGKTIPANQLQLTPEQLEKQSSNGTWSDLYNRAAAINQSPVLAVLIYYLFSLVLAWITFPLLALAMPGLRDRGYGFARLAGFMLLALLAFVSGSAGIPVTRFYLVVLLLVIAALGAAAWILNRESMKTFLREQWRQLLVIEAIMLLTFGFFLFVRTLNPDLWHPWRGGEKPMDFAYFNAVLKSVIFPAYDPWFAGGYINYYYYGFVVVGMPIKLLGIIPATAYNLILPMWYGLLFTGAYSLGSNLTYAVLKQQQSARKRLFGWPFWAGIATALLMAFLGNLGEARLLSETFQTIGAEGVSIESGTLIQKLIWLIRGFFGYSELGSAIRAPGDWYWIPSRVIPGDPITEFPYFTFLYADLHAHLIAMPMVLFSIGWGLSTLLNKARLPLKKLQKVIATSVWLAVGAMVIGALKPTNTWDYYTFLTLNIVVLLYVGVRYTQPIRLKLPHRVDFPLVRRLVSVLLPVIGLVLLSMLLYAPFNNYFFPGFSQVGMWWGDRTPLSSYFTHWGLLIFITFFWYLWESYQWLATTPVSALEKLKPFKKMLAAAGAFLVLATLYLIFKEVIVAIVVVPFCLWSLLLLLKPDQPDAKRLAFFMIATGFLLTLVVELVYLVGDIGRMNVVFKLYNQAWLLITSSLGLGLILCWKDQTKWTNRTQLLFQIPLMVLVAAALLFPLLGTMDKVTDRMNINAPRGLDGMAYMASSRFWDMNVDMDLNQDYQAIQWLQDNVQGSPTILEGYATEYKWGGRFAIYTGLPDVVGWNYHQRQQRAVLRNNVVWERVDEVNHVYQTLDLAEVQAFLNKYDIKYIIIGQMERAYYLPESLAKFEAQAGILWDIVYRDQNTVIYEVKR